MPMNDTDIEEIQLMAKEELGVDLASQDAFDLGERMLAFWRAIYKPIPNENEYEKSIHKKS